MIKLKEIGNFFIFIITGIATIIVGSFMLRGNMHMWDHNDEDKKTRDDK